jgi:hypothetical protein
MLLDWSTIVLTKVAGLTFKSSSPVDDAPSFVMTEDEEEQSCGSDVQLTECIIIILGSVERNFMVLGDGGGFVVVQNETRRFLFFNRGDSIALAGSVASVSAVLPMEVLFLEVLFFAVSEFV